MVGIKRLFKAGSAGVASFGRSLIPAGGGIKVTKPTLSKMSSSAPVWAHLKHGTNMRKIAKRISNPLSGVTTRQPYTKFRKGNRPRPRGLKKVHVPPRLRKQILSVAEKTHVFGYMQENYAIVNVGPANVTNQNNVDDTVWGNTPGNGGLFSYNHVLHCASRIWNSKPANANPTFLDALNFKFDTTEFFVRKQWVTFRMRNNSNRTLRVKLLLCSPKGTKCLATPKATWIAGINDELSVGRLIGNNLATTSINQMYTHPKTIDGFNNTYTTSEVDFTLEPGNAIEHNIAGPSMKYEGAKFVQNGNYNVFQKQDVFPMLVVQSDLSFAPLSGYGHVSDSTSAIGDALITECTYHCQMSMPEPAGWVSGGVAPAAGPVPNTKRIKAFVYDEFNNFIASGAGTVTRVDEEQPRG